MLSSALPDFAPFSISLRRFGVFPNSKRPRVVWVEVEDTGAITRLQSNLEGKFQNLGFAPETQPFSPHLTLARLKREAEPADFERLSLFLEDQEKLFTGSDMLAEVVLFRSDLSSGGARYTKLFSVQFGESKEETLLIENN
ncbi:MAG: RNA 2',3'-cyclic phosphodiesterase [Chloroflexi bacterium]|nr:RNA 2',3'-cyclic phosphodiesterase [Chloroflexota bacterium]